MSVKVIPHFVWQEQNHHTFVAKKPVMLSMDIQRQARSTYRLAMSCKLDHVLPQVFLECSNLSDLYLEQTLRRRSLKLVLDTENSAHPPVWLLASVGPMLWEFKKSHNPVAHCWLAVRRVSVLCQARSMTIKSSDGFGVGGWKTKKILSFDGSWMSGNERL